MMMMAQWSSGQSTSSRLPYQDHSYKPTLGLVISGAPFPPSCDLKVVTELLKLAGCETNRDLSSCDSKYISRLGTVW